mgnify:CR=1 FL=1
MAPQVLNLGGYCYYRQRVGRIALAFNSLFLGKKKLKIGDYLLTKKHNKLQKEVTVPKLKVR